ncbi:MAG: hypothetical protein ABI083_08785 [Lapillicoccus sp.]
MRSVVLGAIAWVLIVLTCATGVWFVIDRVGREVFSQALAAGGTPADPAGTASTPAPPTSSTLATSPTTATSTPSPTTLSVSVPVPSPRAGTSTRTRTGGTVPPPSPAPTTPPPTSPPQTPQPPATTSGTVTVTGGRVGAACTGTRVSLGFATPESGWSFTVKAEADHIEVHFVATGGHGESKVTALCTAGAPVFETSETGDGGDG